MVIRTIRNILADRKLDINATLPEAETPEKPETTALVKICEGEYVHQTGVDALLSFLPEDLSWKGPVNSVLLREIGEKLDEYVLEHIIAPKRGSVYAMPVDMWDGPRILFAIVPKWDGGMNDEERVLKKCFVNSLKKAEEVGVRVLAMPALGAGRRDFPIRKAGRLVLRAIRGHRFETVEEVRIVCKTTDMMQAYRDLTEGYELSTA